MTCDEVRPLLGAWADDELDATTAVAVADHIAQCERCAALAESDRAAREAVRAAMPRFDAPDLLVARVRAAIAAGHEADDGAVPRPSRISRIGRRVAAALVLVAVGSAGTLLVQRAGEPRDVDAGALVARQVDALIAHRSIAVASSEHHTVKPWFAGRVPFSPPVPTLDSSGVTLAGARVDTVAGQPAAVLEYHKRLHVIAVFVRYAPAGGAFAPYADARGYHVVIWHDGDLDFAAVSDINDAELREFAEAFRRAR